MEQEYKETPEERDRSLIIVFGSKFISKEYRKSIEYFAFLINDVRSRLGIGEVDHLNIISAVASYENLDLSSPDFYKDACNIEIAKLEVIVKESEITTDYYPGIRAGLSSSLFLIDDAKYVESESIKSRAELKRLIKYEKNPLARQNLERELSGVKGSGRNYTKKRKRRKKK